MNERFKENKRDPKYGMPDVSNQQDGDSENSSEITETHVKAGWLRNWCNKCNRPSEPTTHETYEACPYCGAKVSIPAIAIVGILATFAFPMFIYFMCQGASKEAE